MEYQRGEVSLSPQIAPNQSQMILMLFKWLWTLEGVEWEPGMDWLGGLAETEFGEVVRLEEWEWGG